MPRQLQLPDRLADEGWKVKVYDRERLEPPHVTVLRGHQAWRWDLRARRFMDREPDPRDVSREIRVILVTHHDALVRLWNRTHPSNPVDSAEDQP